VLERGELGQPSPPPASAVLALVGGLAIAAGSFLDWFGARSIGVAAVSVSGIESWAGVATFACGVVAAVLGALAVAARTPRRPPWGASVVVAGACALLVSLTSAAMARERLVDAAVGRIAAATGVDDALARAVVERALRLSEVSVAVEAGLFVVVGGGLLAVLAGAVPVLASRRPAGSAGIAARRGRGRDGGSSEAR
jgi:hypothetical protein